ncbi:aminotransferase [Chitinimonas arctica]|uniref:GDP-perosamine synthase n=1 Tax=Chitinimonas arctica TaxID=2594795 RepID=A0A516SC38_9NEIS|nr:aminotransferase class I/II-fold pyridoxal phosphate-dependent enzyme [Chitinimonas arctica]QDQ25715.1 aminotransferase [Chitinimonas arctica]
MNIAEISVGRSTTLFDALAILDVQASGILLLQNEQRVFERTITDGDIRRLLLDGVQLQDNLMGLPRIESIVVQEGITREVALALMNQHMINHLPVLDEAGCVIKVIERRDLDEQILLSTPHLGSWEREFVDQAFRTNWIAPLGPNVDAFEKELAEYVGISHAAALSSGTAAIHLALRILGVGKGDWVFCSSLTFVASANPIIYQGAQPVFIDSEPQSWNMSPIALEKAFVWAKREGKLPKAVIVVNLYGQSADMDPIMDLCQKYGVPMVEDAAESLGAKYKGKWSGTFGVMGIYSFNGNKIITTSGGGMLVSENEDLIKKARFLATQARDAAPHYEHTEIGYNYRMSNILAGVGRGQIRVLDERVEARRNVFQVYKEKLAHLPLLKWMPEPEWSRSTHWLTACTLSEDATVSSTDLIRRLAADSIEARPLWKPMHMQPIFASCPSFDHFESSVCAALFNRGICLPSGSNMSADQQERVVELISNYLTR